MLHGTKTNINLKYHSIVLMVVIFSFGWPFCSCYKLPPDVTQLNPNIRCPGKNEQNIWHYCNYGGYIENPDPKHCADRYVCYKGLNESCSPGVDRCANNAICTDCEICQKCDHPDNCSDFKLCPTANGYSALNILKLLLQKRLIDSSE